MLEKYKTLSLTHLSEKPQAISPDRTNKDLNLEDSAISVLTDHRLEQTPSCELENSLEFAMQTMSKNNCNLLLVKDSEEKIIGLISSSDISGEKPIQYVKESGKKRCDLKVKHLMTPIEAIPSIDTKAALDASIGDVLNTLDSVGSEYILVSTMEKDQLAIRGIFSARTIAKSLDIFFTPSPAARNFMDYTKALHGSSLTH